MNWLDVVLLIVLAASVAMSFRKGLSREVIGLASVVLGLLLGAWFYGTAAGWVEPYVRSRAAANFAGFLIVFCAVLVLGGVLSWFVGRFLKVTGLSIVDHALGAAFGLVRGILIAVALIMAILAFSTDHKPPQSVVDSRIAPYVASASQVFVAVAPHELKDGFQKTYAQVKESWAHALEKGADTDPETGKGKK